MYVSLQFSNILQYSPIVPNACDIFPRCQSLDLDTAHRTDAKKEDVPGVGEDSARRTTYSPSSVARHPEFGVS